MNREFINIFLHTMRLVRKYVFVHLIGFFFQCKQYAGLEWKLVFEAFSYGLPNAHALFTGNDVTANSSSLDDKQHFKHPIVNEWNNINISRVKIEIIQNEVPMAYVTFNGHQSDRKSWMSIENILESSYSDVTYSSLKQYVGKNGFHFSVDGYDERRFYMNRNFGGCQNDVGWLGLVEGHAPCDYEKGTKTPYEYALVGFVAPPTSSNLKTNIEFAASMRIFLEFVTSLELGNTDEPLESTSTTIAPETKTAEFTTISPKIGSGITTESTMASGSNCTMCNSCDVIDTNLSISELKDMIKKLQDKLKVDKAKLSTTIRRLNSAQDPRLSSTAIAVVFGGTIFGSVFAVLILPDFINLIRFIYHSWQRLCRK